MNEKPEALRLADELTMDCHAGTQQNAAAELRRLHALSHTAVAMVRYLHEENERLREKNERLQEALEIIAGYRQCVDPLMGNQDVARAALRGRSDG